MRGLGSRQRRRVKIQLRLLALLLLLFVFFESLHELRPEWLSWFASGAKQPRARSVPGALQSIILPTPRAGVYSPADSPPGSVSGSASSQTTNTASVDRKMLQGRTLTETLTDISQLPPLGQKSEQEMDTKSRRVDEGGTNTLMTSDARNASSSSSSSRSRDVVLFSTWRTRDYKRGIHDNVLRTWPLLSPDFTLLLFSDEEEERRRAEAHGWLSSPLPSTACGQIPLLREMFLVAMDTCPRARLFGFVNGDLLLGAGLRDTLRRVLENPVAEKEPVLMLLHRLDLPFSEGADLRVDDLSAVEKLRVKAVRISHGSSDAFVTNRLFPWSRIPDVVPGRPGVGMWMVAASRTLGVAVIDLTATVTVLHMTSSAGNLESHHLGNTSCNVQLFRKLGLIPSSWSCGRVDCADWRSVFAGGDDVTRVTLQRKVTSDASLPTYCQPCLLDTKRLLQL